ncbi:MAG: hypothetical protein KGJ84_01005 [Elusimicrobia bacterium]|nr:hypothetical protein [Elusimicrobiota bacterium]
MGALANIAGQPAAKVREFLRRAYDGSWDPSYAAKKLHVRINDIDLLLNIVPKEKDGEKQRLLEQRRTEEALRQGISPTTFVDQISWPWLEVLRYLEARSRSISLHTDDRILKYGKSKVIYTGRS